MVLWEITLGTAYFLGLKRTYKLALKIQRKLITPKHPKIRQFVQRRTRNIFDVALKVHLKVQERDIEVGRNVGNWILRWLDKLKPEAQIRVPPTNANTTMTKQLKGPSHLDNNNNSKSGLTKNNGRSIDNKESDRHLFTARNVWPKSFPTISMMMRPSGPNSQYRQYGTTDRSEFFTVGKFGQVLRNDVRHWIMHH
ncbi:hypothetical protein ACP275_05G072800 [Erythranthe tilingii]